VDEPDELDELARAPEGAEEAGARTAELDAREAAGLAGAGPSAAGVHPAMLTSSSASSTRHPIPITGTS